MGLKKKEKKEKERTGYAVDQELFQAIARCLPHFPNTMICQHAEGGDRAADRSLSDDRRGGPTRRHSGCRNAGWLLELLKGGRVLGRGPVAGWGASSGLGPRLGVGFA